MTLGASPPFACGKAQKLVAAAGFQHSVGFGQVEAHRFLQHVVLSGGGGIDGNRAVEIIWNAYYHQIDFIHLEQFAVIREMMGKSVLFRKNLGLAFAGRSNSLLVRLARHD